MFLKVMNKESANVRDFSLFEGERILVGSDQGRSVTIEGYKGGACSVAIEPNLDFYILNDKGDTIERINGANYLAPQPMRNPPPAQTGA